MELLTAQDRVRLLANGRLRRQAEAGNPDLRGGGNPAAAGARRRRHVSIVTA